MSTKSTFVIVGAGLAGASAALSLREEGFEGSIVLFGDEGRLPYELPPLSKGYLRGEEDADALLFRSADVYRDHDIELRLDTHVERLDLARHEVITQPGEAIRFDRLLLATGSQVRRLAAPEAELPNIFYLRTIADAGAIKEAAGRAYRAVIVGGGWIGAEVAASLRQLGLQVALVAPGDVPLEKILGREVGTIYRELHVEHGVELHPNEVVTGFSGSARVDGVLTRAGNRIKGDLVVVGVGAIPRSTIASAVGVGIDARGAIVVDEFLEAAPGVFAAGDVAAAWHPVFGERLRFEHWDNAQRQGATAARNMLGRRRPYDALPYFYSDQYDLGMEYVGYARGWDRVVLRGDVAGREFIAFWLRDGVPVAAMNANIWDVNDDLRALVDAGRSIDPQRLADVDVPVAELLAAEPVAG